MTEIFATEKSILAKTDGERLQRLVTQLSWASQRIMSRQLETFGLTLPQWMTLRALANSRKPGCTLNDLADVSHQVPATMTGIIKRLVQRELVERQRNENDRRALSLCLSAKGAKLVKEIEELQNLHYESMMSNFTPHERENFLELMNIYLEQVICKIELLKSKTTGTSQ